MKSACIILGTLLAVTLTAADSLKEEIARAAANGSQINEMTLREWGPFFLPESIGHQL